MVWPGLRYAPDPAGRVAATPVKSTRAPVPAFDVATFV